MRIVELVSKGFWVAKNSPYLVLMQFVFLFISSIVMFVFAQQEESSAPSLTIQVAQGVAFWLLAAFIQAGTIFSISCLIKNDQNLMANFFQGAKNHFASLLWVGSILAVIYLVSAFVAMSVTFFSAIISPFLSMVMLLILAPLGIYFFAPMLVFGPYAVVLNNAGWLEAIKTSLTIAKRHFWTFLATLALFVGVWFGLSALFELAVPQKVSNLLDNLLSAYLFIAATGAFLSFFLAESEKNIDSRV